MDLINVNKFKKGTRVRVNKWHYDKRLPVPCFGITHMLEDIHIAVALDTPYRHQVVWYFLPEELSPIGFDESGMSEKARSEMLEILKADKPADHILADLEDYLTDQCNE